MMALMNAEYGRIWKFFRVNFFLKSTGCTIKVAVSLDCNHKRSETEDIPTTLACLLNLRPDRYIGTVLNRSVGQYLILVKTK